MLKPSIVTVSSDMWGGGLLLLTPSVGVITDMTAPLVSDSFRIIDENATLHLIIMQYY